MRLPGLVFSLVLLAAAPAWAAPVDAGHRAAILAWKARVLDPYASVTVIDRDVKTIPESVFIDMLIERRSGTFRISRIDAEGSAPAMRIELMTEEEEAAERKRAQLQRPLN